MGSANESEKHILRQILDGLIRTERSIDDPAHQPKIAVPNGGDRFTIATGSIRNQGRIRAFHGRKVRDLGARGRGIWAGFGNHD